MSNDNLSGLILELRRGTIVLSVLSKLQKPMYGYSLVSELTESGIPVEGNTLYPMLRRLESQGLLESRWDTAEAKPRKYYAVTAEGGAVRETLERNWREIVESMNRILEEDAQ